MATNKFPTPADLWTQTEIDDAHDNFGYLGLDGTVTSEAEDFINITRDKKKLQAMFNLKAKPIKKLNKTGFKHRLIRLARALGYDVTNPKVARRILKDNKKANDPSRDNKA